MANDPVPAITEAEATGETAEIFADLRNTLGVNVVNLVWRHIATFPNLRFGRRRPGGKPPQV